MSTSWSALGFSASPYNVQPLKVAEDHVPLLVGRSDDGVQFCTFIDSAPEGVFVISGSPGVGKTSFFNIFQHLLESGRASCGPRLLAARTLCPLQADDSARVIALRVLQILIKNVDEWCRIRSRNLPSQIEKLSSWIGGKSSVSWDFSISILGNGGGIGRSVQMPAVSEATFENFQDAISVVVAEVVSRLDFDGVFIALDNVENLNNDRLSEILMSFRDTLFSVEKVWWVIIGQSGLYSLVQALDSRVTDRIAGSGLELLPISLDELSNAVDFRVEKFHERASGKSPLSNKIHKMLYEASYGEIRFVFKYCNTICLNVVSDVRKHILAQKIPFTEESFNRIMGESMIEDCIDDDLAAEVLKRIVALEIDGLGLRQKDKKLLVDIGAAGQARSKDFKSFGFSSGQDFSSNYLTRLQAAGLLVRKQEGRAAIYRLRGLSVLANRFGLL
ncbi:hypothetical protein ACQVBX_08485 [Dyella sp. KULCS107]|uniref:hypothetical protein n=1 Tax=Dyella sp. KULCS107 TaxID=3422216 RepID=UPI003D6E530A